MSDIYTQRKYRLAYEMKIQPWGNALHSYTCVGRWGAVSLHITDLSRMKEAAVEHSAGLEYHRRQPLPDNDSPPSHEKCWLIGGPCWHDGTSLYAQEKYVPMFRQGGDPDHIWRAMMRDADEYFAADGIFARAVWRQFNDPS